MSEATATAEKKVSPKKKPAASTKAKAKSELRKPQVRILAVLVKGKPLTRAQIAEKAPVDNAMCTSYIGSLDETVRKKTDKAVMMSLLSLGFVSHKQYDKDGKDVVEYSITASGRKALDAAK